MDEPLSGEPERLALANDVIDVRLEIRGHVVIVDRGANHEIIGFEDLGDEPVRQLQERLHFLGVLVLRREVRAEPRQRDEREVGLRQVAIDDAAIRVVLFPLPHEPSGESARHGVFASGTGFYDQ